MKDRVSCPECGKRVKQEGLDDHLRDKHNMIIGDHYEPDYDAECINCGQSPVVTLADANGKEMMRTDLCGPCTWGEAKCIDPGEW